MNDALVRDPRAAANDTYDLVIVGGGIYGACLALESARRGLRPLLVERDDFGEATSLNSLRIVHGGLRYLQNLDFSRFAESVRERRWFLRHFPDLVQPLDCLMPLYGRGLRRPAIFRLALAINDFLSRHRNDGVRVEQRLPNGTVLSREHTLNLFPDAVGKGLCGGARWHDAVILNPGRLPVEILRWASACGATALNYVEGRRLLIEHGRVVGLEAADHETGDTFAFRAPVVVNCAGPWCRQLAVAFDRDLPRLFHPSLAFNVLLDRTPLSSMALAVAPPQRGASTYFLLPLGDRILAGTRHTTWSGEVTEPVPTGDQVDDFLGDLNAAVPGLRLSQRDVQQVHAGFLPAVTAGSHRQAKRPVVIDHGARGGPRNLYSVSGVKLTTARAVAEKTLQIIFAGRGRSIAVCSGTDRPDQTCLTTSMSL